MKCTFEDDLPKTVFVAAEQIRDGRIQLRDRQGRLYYVSLQDLLDNWCARTAVDGLVDVRVAVANTDTVAESGNKIRAVKLARNLLGLTLAEAKEFIEGKTGRFFTDQIEFARSQLLPLGYAVEDVIKIS